MHQALNLAKAQGKAPGAVEETIHDAHRSTLDWRSLLRRYMTDTAARDYSWSVPNRRFIDSGLYLPSIRSEGMETLAVIIDTSGSVDSDALAAFWSEVRGVAAEIEPERIVVLQVDAAVQDERELRTGRAARADRRQGTLGDRLPAGLRHGLRSKGIQPAVCLYFTDMDCDRYPETEPDFERDLGGLVDSAAGGLSIRNRRPGASTSGSTAEVGGAAPTPLRQAPDHQSGSTP